MTASALKYDHDISAESLKLFWYEEVVGRWIEIKIYYYIIYRKSFLSFPMHWKKFSFLFLLNFVPHQILNFLLMFHFSDFVKLNFMKKSSQENTYVRVFLILVKKKRLWYMRFYGESFPVFIDYLWTIASDTITYKDQNNRELYNGHWRIYTKKLNGHVKH